MNFYAVDHLARQRHDQLLAEARGGQLIAAADAENGRQTVRSRRFHGLPSFLRRDWRDALGHRSIRPASRTR
jgi:hypothetical protein